jgi:hypothetical protein
MESQRRMHKGKVKVHAKCHSHIVYRPQTRRIYLLYLCPRYILHIPYNTPKGCPAINDEDAHADVI